MNKRTIKGEIVVEYITKFPKTPNSTLAKKIYKENPEAFKDKEDAREMVRYYRGQKGKTNRHRAVQPTEKGELAKKLGIPNPYELPESEESEWLPFDIPKGNDKLLILSDVHIPYHNIKALELAIKYGKDRGCNAVVLNGDIMDCYALSRYEKDPRKRRFAQELEDTRQFLGYLKQELNCPIYYKLGNHEERYEAYLRIKAPEILDIEEFRLDVLLRFGEYGAQLISDKRIIKAGKLNVLHGHEFGRSVFSPVNPARGYYNRAKSSMIAGHNHQTSEHTESNLNGKIVTCWSTGCLCELHPAYMPINKWNYGFAFVTLEGEEFDVDNLRIINSKIR